MSGYKYFHIITIFNVTFLLVSDVTAGKIIEIFGFSAAASTLLFPLVYIISDITTEVYGYAAARRMAWFSIMASFTSGIAYQLAVYMPAAPGFENGDAYRVVLGQVPRIMIVGWVAVFCGDIVNNYVLAKMKIWTKGRHLWLRTISSTFAGQFLNSILFYFAALYGVIPFDLLVEAMVFSLIGKILIEIVMTPVTYFVVHRLKMAENFDYYDTDTDFNPFLWRKKGRGDRP